MCGLNLEDHDDFQYRLLSKISGEPGISSTKLYPAVRVAKSTLDEAIVLLVKDGLIERSEPENPRRQGKYSITAFGSERLELLRGPFMARRQSDLDAMSEEVEIMTRSLSARRSGSALGYEGPNRTPDVWQNCAGQE